MDCLRNRGCGRILDRLKASAATTVVRPIGGTQGVQDLSPLRHPRGYAHSNESIVFTEDCNGRARRDAHGFTERRQAGFNGTSISTPPPGGRSSPCWWRSAACSGAVGPLRRVAWAALHAPTDCPRSPKTQRIRYEPGAENLARSIATGLPAAAPRRSQTMRRGKRIAMGIGSSRFRRARCLFNAAQPGWASRPG
jgi:hypothetical protein